LLKASFRSTLVCKLNKLNRIQPNDNMDGYTLFNSLSPVRVRTHGHSIIHHSGSYSMYSCCEHSPMASLPLFVTYLSLLTSANPLGRFSPPFLQNFSNSSIISREHGKLKRGSLYYNFIVRATLTPHIYPH
jgi:hypothetical protein